MLTAQDAKTADDIKREKVFCPEWAPKAWSPEQIAADAFYWAQGLTGDERDEFEASLVEVRRKKKAQVNMKSMRAKLVARGTVDDQGNRVFSDDDVAWLGKKSAAPIDRLYDAIARLSRITEEDLEELEKNLQKIPSDGSS